METETVNKETTVIIRTKNEEKRLGTVLQKLFSQTYQDFEVLIIDSGSKDRTLEIARKFSTRVFSIPEKTFSYPYALNYGAGLSNGVKYLVILSGHSLPVSQTWLEDGISNFKKYQNVLGVYGPLRPLPDSGFWDFVIMRSVEFLRRLKFEPEEQIINHAEMGVLGFTNAIIKKDLWQERHFNEDFGAGGEDGEWASYWLKRGYIIIKDRKFMVYHSHGLGPIGWFKQWQYWKSLSSSRPFKRPNFRT